MVLAIESLRVSAPADQPRGQAGGDESSGSRSVRRVLDIFEFMLARNEPVTVAGLVAELSIPKSTAYELVRLLTERDYLAPSGRGAGLFLGRKLFELGMAYRGNVDLLLEGSRMAEALRDATGETVQLSVLDGDHMLVLLKEESVRPLRIISQVGSRVPVNWAAAGRLLVSDMDDKALRHLLEATVRQSPSGHACTDIDRLVGQVRSFRAQGYATEQNEANEHAGCVAAPVFDTNHRCIAALSIVAPLQRLDEPNRSQLIDRVKEAAATLSQRLV